MGLNRYKKLVRRTREADAAYESAKSTADSDHEMKELLADHLPAMAFAAGNLYRKAMKELASLHRHQRKGATEWAVRSLRRSGGSPGARTNQ
jgi:hypothetical protein